MVIAFATTQGTGLASLLSKLPIQPEDLDVNDAGDTGMSWEFPGPHFIQLEIPAGSQTAIWTSWRLDEFHQETPEHHLELNNPISWEEFIHTMKKRACRRRSIPFIEHYPRG